MFFLNSIDLFLKFISSYCSEDTIYYYSINLDFFKQYITLIKNDDFNVKELTKADYIGYISFIRKKGVKNTSVRTYSRAIKVYLRWLYNEGYIEVNITQNVKYPLPDNRLIRPLSVDDVDYLLSYIAKGKCGVRNVLIFRLMLDCGLRLQEVVNLNVNDFDEKNMIICINNSKFNKSRLVPMSRDVLNSYNDYMSCRKSDCNALLLDFNDNNRITKTAIKKYFYRLKRKYKVDVYPHLLRHTFATSFIMGGGHIEILRLLMGHNDYTVTKNYIHLASQYSLACYDIYKLDKCVFKSYMSYNI